MTMKSVLVVEDDDDSRHVLRTILRDEGFRAVTARNGRVALDVLRIFVPSVIVLDLRMPELDGWGFDRERSRIPTVASVPLIVISAFDHSESRLYELDAKFFLRKPLNIPLFLRLVRSLTEDQRIAPEDEQAASPVQLAARR